MAVWWPRFNNNSSFKVSDIKTTCVVQARINREQAKKVIELGKPIKVYLDNTIPRPTTELELLLPPLAILERGLFLQRGPGPEEGELKWEIPARPK